MGGVVGDTGDEILGMAEGFADGNRGFVRVKPLTVMTAEPPDHGGRKTRNFLISSTLAIARRHCVKLSS
ncbi:hypothetical protein E2542_SST09663 [Spatholobus suberectus]|nr:hypothetical protein E2542_SST09663 [Spatholobus suberectus]